MFKYLIVILSFLQSSFLFSQSALNFDDYFIDKTMRIDFFHMGDAKEEFITVDFIYQQGIWAGSFKNLIDPFNNGSYFIKVYDVDSNQLLFSKGFNTIFAEYKTTKPALEGKKRVYHETAIIPYPKNPVKFEIALRNKKNLFDPIFSQTIDPNDIHIIRESARENDTVFNILDNGDPHHKVDLVLLGDGYTINDKDLFREHLEKYTEVLFSLEPFKSNKTKFNVYGIFNSSDENGVDEPTKNIYKNTIINSSFNSFDTPRYLLTEDNKSIQNIAAQAPFDAICIMVNHERYGGGGIYNFYCIFTANEGKWNEHVFLHEFGHSFAGLADEYYSSDVAYQDFFPQGVEPAEPNITRLLNSDNLKWKDYLTPGLSVPTDWDKDEFDNLDNVIENLYKESQSKVENMNSKEKIDEVKKEYQQRISEYRNKKYKFLVDHPLQGKTGVFEGAGYSTQGIYRSTVNSLMHQFNEEDKCYYRVNEEAIKRMINYYSE